MAKATSKNTDIVPAFQNPILADDPQELALIIEDNLGANVQLTVSDLDRIKVEGSSFLVPTLEGEEPTREISGVILLSK